MLEPVPLPPAGVRQGGAQAEVRAWLSRVLEEGAVGSSFKWRSPVLRTNVSYLRQIAPRGVIVTTRRTDHAGLQTERGFTWLYAIKEGTP